MDISLGDLNKMPIKKLKAILKKLKKEPESIENATAINIIENLIRDKKKKGTILHEIINQKGKFLCKKGVPVHLTTF